MPQDGLGLSVPRETNTAAAANDVVARATAPAKPRAPASAVPQFNDDPIAAIGFILQEVGAGFQGREGPADRAQSAAIQAQGLRLRETAATLQAIRFGAEQLKTVPEDRHEEVIINLERTVGLPGIADTLRAMSRPGIDRDAVLSILDASPETGAAMADLIRKGLATPEEGVDFLQGIAAKRAETAITAPTNIAKLQSDRDKAVREGRAGDAREIQAQIDKLGTVVGRTPEDLAAQAQAKAQAAESLPLDAFTRDLLDLPKNMTIGQARESGIQVPSDPERKRIQEIEAGGKQSVSLIGQIRRQIEASPQAITAGGEVASFFNQLRANLQGLTDLFDFDVDLSAERSKHAETFQKHAVDTDLLKSLVLDLAYVQAVARGQTGRGLSDPDVERFSRIIGAGRADPATLTPILESLEERFDTAFRSQVESITRREPPSLLSHVREVESILRRDRLGEAITDAELEALSDRARALLRERLSGG